jgi:hypothetical protein
VMGPSARAAAMRSAAMGGQARRQGVPIAIPGPETEDQNRTVGRSSVGREYSRNDWLRISLMVIGLSRAFPLGSFHRRLSHRDGPSGPRF